MRHLSILALTLFIPATALADHIPTPRGCPSSCFEDCFDCELDQYKERQDFKDQSTESFCLRRCSGTCKTSDFRNECKKKKIPKKDVKEVCFSRCFDCETNTFKGHYGQDYCYKNCISKFGESDFRAELKARCEKEKKVDNVDVQNSDNPSPVNNPADVQNIDNPSPVNNPADVQNIDNPSPVNNPTDVQNGDNSQQVVADNKVEENPVQVGKESHPNDDTPKSKESRSCSATPYATSSSFALHVVMLLLLLVLGLILPARKR